MRGRGDGDDRDIAGLGTKLNLGYVGVVVALIDFFHDDAFFFADRFVERVNGGLEHLVIGAASARMPEGNGDRVFGRVCQGGAGGADEHDQRQGKGDELFHGGIS